MGIFDFFKKKTEPKLPSKGNIHLSDFNFKLAIIEELMYNQEILTPKFNAYEFCQKNRIDFYEYGQEYAYQVPPKIKDWFEKLEIPIELAEKVTSLYFDGGNDIYCQAAIIWDGEDDLFDIVEVSEKELSQFPNLKKVDGTALLMTEEVKSTFRNYGIEVIE